jgi:hypothetical protein
LHFPFVELRLRIASNLMQKISIVVPCYNDEPVLPKLFERLEPVAGIWGMDYVYYIRAYLPVDGRMFLLPRNELVKRWFGCLPRLFPGFDVTCVAERHLFRFRAAQHIVDMDYEKKNPACRTPPPGGFPANFPQIFPENRGANFAVREGIKIAEMARQEAEMAFAQ